MARNCCNSRPIGDRLFNMDDAIEKVEIKCAYLEAQVAELNDIVYEQQKCIDSLTIQLQKLSKKVEELIEESGEARPNRRPPHY